MSSGLLGRSDNLRRVLQYICEEHFQGRADQIKEYTVATEALGRRSGFDPQTDTIVRVTIHALRKRLIEIYQNEGVGRSIRLVIPPGHYAPSFIPQSQRNKVQAIAVETESGEEATGPPAMASPPVDSDSVGKAAGRVAWRPRPLAGPRRDAAGCCCRWARLASGAEGSEILLGGSTPPGTAKFDSRSHGEWSQALR